MLLLIASSLAAAPDTPDDLAAEALMNSPTLSALDARTRQLEALAAVADLWPDPMLGLEYSNVAVSAPLPANHPMSGVQLKAQQMLPAPGVTGLRAEVAEGRVAISEEARREAELQLSRRVEQTWWRLTLSRSLGLVTEQHLERTTELLAAVRSRYETGGAGQSALLRLQLLEDRLRDDLGEFIRAEHELSAGLAQALSRDTADFETPTSITPVAVDGDVESWLGAALEARPELQRLDRVAENAERSADLARAEGRIDPTLWAGYRVRTQEADGTDLLSVGVSVPVPVHSKRRAEGVAAGHLEAAAGSRAQREAAVDALGAQLRTAHARWTRAADKCETYETVLLPSAETTLEATLSDYRVGEADFASLYDAEVGLLQIERARLSAAAETHIQRAEVRALVGGTL